jgi:hypothetical protein
MNNLATTKFIADLHCIVIAHAGAPKKGWNSAIPPFSY